MGVVFLCPSCEVAHILDGTLLMGGDADEAHGDETFMLTFI